ncbi:MAG: hypothetical protein VX127_00160 [Myxococcota bacterium]|nr:hypothetical protein [Myxococcota bacterium]
MIGLWLVLVACGGTVEKSEHAAGAAKHPHFPFPSMHHMADGRVALPEDLPLAAGGTAVAIERVRWREGYSVAQTSVVDLNVAVDGTSLPGPSEPQLRGAVQLWDLTAGAPILAFAELDAAEPVADEHPALIVRPQELLPPGHRIAVVVTDRVQTTDGEPLAPIAWYADVLAGTPGPGLSPWVDHYRALQAELEALGVEGVALAFDFPVADGGQPVRSIAERVGVPPSYTIDEVRSTDDGIAMPEGGWLELKGTYAADNWLVDDTQLALDPDGMPIHQGTVDAELHIYVPESVRDAEPGTVPVWVFGHGLFEKPDTYLGDRDDTSKVMRLADEAGAIVCATVWRGFKDSDRIHAIQIADDFGRIHEITERLTQGVSNVIGLTRLLVDGDLLNDPALRGLPSTNGDLRYYGISLGGIAGAVAVANTPLLQHAVFHVGGGAWSTMLERSSQWIPFDWIMVEQIPSPRDRQLLYALSQLFWDPVDPINHVSALQDRSVMWQEAIGDEQVANMTTRMVARAVGATQLMPVVAPVVGLDAAVGPLAGPGYVQFDPERAIPADANRPSVPTGAHSIPRRWPGLHAQVIAFNDWVEPGRIHHFCGDHPCSESNPGDYADAPD